MPALPDKIPSPTVSPYSGELKSPIVRTSFITGKGIVRRMYSDVPQFRELSFVMNSDQAQYFEGFYHYELNDGADWFEMDLTLPDGTETRTVRFREMYKVPDPYGSKNNWTVRAVIELQDRPIITKSEYNAL